MKKIFSFLLLAFVLTTSVCCAARVRVCDYGLNDFVNYYNQLAKITYERGKELDLRFNERPFKNLTYSDANYNVYTCTVGKEKDNTVMVYFFVDKSGYVNKMIVSGFTKKAKQENLISGVILLCLMSCGVDTATLSDWGDFYGQNLFTYNNSSWIELTERKRRIYIESRSTSIPATEKHKPYAVDIFGASI